MRNLRFPCMILSSVALTTSAFAQATSPGGPPPQQQTPPVQIQPQANVPAITMRAPLTGQVPVLIQGFSRSTSDFDAHLRSFGNRLGYRAVHATPQRRDYDGDGDAARRLGGTDCDDEDPTRSGRLPELFDAEGLDEDCDHFTLPARDMDRDGFISWQAMNVIRTNDDFQVVAVVRGPDCDDGRADVHPGLPEVRGDQRDNDCDGLIDVIDTPGHRDYCPPTETVSAQTPTRPCGAANGDASQFQRR